MHHELVGLQQVFRGDPDVSLASGCATAALTVWPTRSQKRAGMSVSAAGSEIAACLVFRSSYRHRVRRPPSTRARRVADLYFLGLNLSNHQTAHEVGSTGNDAQRRRSGVIAAATTPELAGTVEIGEVYLASGYTGQDAE